MGIGCRISIVIPVHNGGENFRRCLASASAIASPDCEIIVVADGDSDGSWKLAEEAGMRVVRIPESGGPARARNLGAREARGDILFFVDADVLMSPETVQQVLAAFQADPGLAAVKPRQLSGAGVAPSGVRYSAPWAVLMKISAALQ